MKPRLVWAAMAGLLAVAAPSPSRAAVLKDAGPTYVIPIKGMIERGLVYLVRRGVNEAVRNGAGTIILDMDTPGGRLDSCEEIINTIMDCGIPTYTFVNPNAISAGAIISLATDKIYMAPGGRIGDAMPILMSPLPMGAPQEMPAGLREKAMSPTVALIRSAAQRKGHDARLAEAMVRPEAGYAIDGKVICPTGQLVTLTSLDAAQLVGAAQRPLLSSGTVRNMDELLDKIGRRHAPLVTFNSSAAEEVARWIEGFPMSGIILALGLLLLYIEFKTPGFGLPGIAGILLLAIWFWGHHIAGLAGMGEILLFLLGVALLAVEVFVLPGFGAAGIAGLACMAAAILMAMVQHYPGGPWYPPRVQMERAIEILGFSILLTVGAGMLLVRYLPRTTPFQKLALGRAVAAADGFRVGADTASLVGLRGQAVTALRPGGTGMFGDRRLDVIARGDFIAKGAPIVVAEAHGNRIVVDVDAARG